MFLDMLRAASKEIEKGDDVRDVLKEFFRIKCSAEDVRWFIENFNMDWFICDSERVEMEEKLERERRETEQKEKERREKEEREEKRRVAVEKGMAEFEKGKEGVRERMKRKMEEDRANTKIGPKAKAAKLEQEKPRFAKITKGDRLGWSLKCGHKVNV